MSRKMDGDYSRVQLVAEISALRQRISELEASERDRTLVEEALRREKSINDAVFESVPGLLYFYDDQNYLIRWNKNHEVMTGYSSEELPFFHVLDWFKGDEESTSVIEKGVESMYRDGYSASEANLITKDGKSIPFFFTAVRLSFEGKNHFVGIGIEITNRKRMEQELKASQDELRRLTVKLLKAEEDEYLHIARELHDDLTQRVVIHAIELGKLEKQMEGSASRNLVTVSKIKEDMIKLSTDIHGLAKRFHSTILHDLGLVKAIQKECSRCLQQDALDVQFVHRNIDDRMPKDIALSLYRIIQEALRNIVRHAQTKSARILLIRRNETVSLSIEDDGVGFDPELAKERGGLGLVSMRERAHMIGGRFLVESRPGKGTLLCVDVAMGGEPK